MILISIGSGGIGALQYFIVVTAVPVSLILLPSLWVAPRIARELAQRNQQ
jgi:choline-glycine betaine transporter